MDRTGGDSVGSVHVLYCIGIAIDRQALVFGEQPASCAARLLVDPQRQIERLDQIDKIDTDTPGRLVAAQRVANLVLAGMEFEQQCVVFAGLPSLSPCRHGPDGKSRGTQCSGLPDPEGPALHDVSLDLSP